MQNLCGFIGGNIGDIKCDAMRGLPKKFSVGGKVFQPSEYATPDLFQAAFKAAHKLASGDPDKLFAFPEIAGNTDQTDALKTASLGYGLKQITLEGRPGYEFQVVVGQATFQAMRKFNRAIVPVYMCDDSNNEWGTYASDKTWSGELAQIFVAGNGYGDGTKTQNATVTLFYQSASDFNDYSKYMPINFNINEAKGLRTVELSEYAAHATNVYHIQGLTETAQLGKFLNAALDYGADLADETLWLCTKVDGTAQVITSVAYVAGKGWTVTFDSTTYTALATGAELFLSWVGPVALDAADIVGVENVEPLVLIK